MSATTSPDQITAHRQTFFNLIYGKGEGFVCIARRRFNNTVFEESYFNFPDETDLLLDNVRRFSPTHDLWYCPQLLHKPKRSKENIAACPSAWADLDHCKPEACLVQPSISVQSSPARYQALWVFDSPVGPAEGEDVSRRIAYHHADEGADKSGWDLTQLLRVPFTKNFKYESETGSPIVRIHKVKSEGTFYTLADFSEYPPVAEFVEANIPFPTNIPQAKAVLAKYNTSLHPYVWTLYYQKPDSDWSSNLWSLQLMLIESGLSIEETFAVAAESACNKYERDNRSERMLWRETCRAWKEVEQRNTFQAPNIVTQEPLLTEEEREQVRSNPSIIEDYIEWASGTTDAAWQYHQAGIFIILSALLSGTVDLPTSFGKLVPNLWFMILADTTLTRKTTAMDIAMDILYEIDPDAVLATDSSIEGLLTGLSHRPSRPSIFLRDEFSGLLEMITKKDYYAGMEETLAKLYDGKMQKRMLRRETVTVTEPRLIIFAGGIKDRIYSLLGASHVESGFLPRFIFTVAEADVTRLKPVGPPTEQTSGNRELIINRLKAIHDYYDEEQHINMNGKTIITKKVEHATMTEEAWLRYNRMEALMLSFADSSINADILRPSFDRLCKSGLKVALLVAASRMNRPLVVGEPDIVRAFYYVEQWINYELDVFKNFGKSEWERNTDRVFKMIRRQPEITRSEIMRRMHLNARDADQIFNTLDQRDLIIRVKAGRTERLQAKDNSYLD